MQKILSNLWTPRVLVIVGFLAGGNAVVGSTFRHIGDERFMTPNAFSATHTWHHFFREGFGDLGAIAAILLILFAAPRHRNPTAWWVMLSLMVGFFAPFWVGVPFMAELAAPNMSAEISHLSMAVPCVLGLILARRHFAVSQ